MVAQAELPRTAAAREGVASQLYLTCVLAGTRYLVPASAVREVEEVGAITPVPATPSWLRGVMNLRGMIVGVVNLAQFLGLATDQALGTEALICAPRSDGRAGDDDLLIALAVEAVSNIRTLAVDELLPLPDQPQSDAVAAHLIGLYRAPAGAGRGEELLGVLDLEGLLRIFVVDQVAAPVHHA
jgi:purine-binding chemotaxis protein CheW